MWSTLKNTLGLSQHSMATNVPTSSTHSPTDTAPTVSAGPTHGATAGSANGGSAQPGTAHGSDMDTDDADEKSGDAHDTHLRECPTPPNSSLGVSKVPVDVSGLPQTTDGTSESRANVPKTTDSVTETTDVAEQVACESVTLAPMIARAPTTTTATQSHTPTSSNADCLTDPADIADTNITPQSRTCRDTDTDTEVSSAGLCEGLMGPTTVTPDVSVPSPTGSSKAASSVRQSAVKCNARKLFAGKGSQHSPTTASNGRDGASLVSVDASNRVGGSVDAGRGGLPNFVCAIPAV